MVTALLSFLTLLTETTATLLLSGSIGVPGKSSADAAGRNVTLPVPSAKVCTMVLIDVWKAEGP